MKITNHGQVKNVSLTPGSIITGKEMRELEQGDKFKATVIDIQPSKVTLRLDDGGSLTAKSLILPEARIGEEAVFLVKENVKGQILLEMYKPEGQMPVEFIKDALANAGLYATEENIELTGQMLKNDLPVDADTLLKAAYFRHLGGGMELDKIMFLLNEDFKPNPLNAELLEGILNKTINMSDSLQNITELLFDDEIFEAYGKDIVLEMLGIKDGSDDKNTLTKTDLKGMTEQKLFLSLKDESVKNLNNYYNEVFRAVIKARDTLGRQSEKGRAAGASASKLANELVRTLENLEFANHIKNYKEYMQIPFIYNECKNQGDLYIFKDRKGQKDFKENASVLITMDFALLGRVEIFIGKEKNNLNFQFKADDDALKSISQNTKKLLEALHSRGFTVSGVSLKKLGEPFNVTMDIEEKKGKPAKRFSFDMRV